MRRAASALLLAIAFVVASAQPARADVPVTRTGWWTRSPSPPTVPEGGLAVGAAPDGDMTVGAVLLDAGAGVSGAQLRLVETGGAAPLAAIRVCPTTSTWSAAAGGPLTDAPPSDACGASSVAMARAAEGTWTADVQPLVDGRTGAIGLIVKPAAGSAVFQVSFAPPTVRGSVAQPPSAGEPSPEPAPASFPSSSDLSFDFAAPAEPPVAAPELAAVTDEPARDSGNTEVAFEPQLGAAVPRGESARDVGKLTVVAWYLVAVSVGAVVSGLVWLRNSGQLSVGALVPGRLRRNRFG